MGVRWGEVRSGGERRYGHLSPDGASGALEQVDAERQADPRQRLRRLEPRGAAVEDEEQGPEQEQLVRPPEPVEVRAPDGEARQRVREEHEQYHRVARPPLRKGGLGINYQLSMSPKEYHAAPVG